ncbi:DUF1446-domain-containing protein [Mollisia scopiformis]|uniref:DUF1446-domain-containing protein n=1 Tax=Mollisia scopiformis TaxID=149040 RepID=A0A194X8F3_MOLSC|nr:DUF1446-domain-containing protein [Mollisia scopiformis]KUJ16072.1 DUF1446-domain-containing protein [Mollisia scopiformis]
MGSLNPTRPVRIMNISGSPCDKRDAIAKAAAMDEHVDVLVGDWMSELNMPTKAWNLSQGVGIGYEETFVEALEPALEDMAKKGIKLAANAGTVATKDLYEVVVKMIKDEGLDLTVAWIEGDVVMDLVRGGLEKEPEKFVHISTGKSLEEWGFEPVFAQCYLGGMGIATAFKAGADVVICGRVADASPIIGAAAWWHGWSRTDYNQLAQSLIAGHLIECSVYVTGGNFTGFKTLDWEQINSIGYPIAEIAYDGDVVITKVENTGGLVSKETCKEQLLYEIQGMYYLNCDVTAVIDKASLTDIAPNRVRLSGIIGRPPPATTKMGLTAFGGYQAELHWAMIGLDIEERVKLLETKVKHSFGKARLAKFSLLDISVYGSVPENPRTQNSAIVDVRLFAQARNAQDLSETNFIRPALDINMHTYPAATFHTDLRTAVPKPYTEYFPTLIPQPTQTIHFSSGQSSMKLEPPTDTIVHPATQPSYEPTDPVDFRSFGSTKRMPLGRVVYSRAGDKGSNCNVGLFARNAEEWPWLCTLLSTEKFIELMADEFKGQKIDCMEFSNLGQFIFSSMIILIVE